MAAEVVVPSSLKLVPTSNRLSSDVDCLGETFVVVSCVGESASKVGSLESKTGPTILALLDRTVSRWVRFSRIKKEERTSQTILHSCWRKRRSKLLRSQYGTPDRVRPRCDSTLALSSVDNSQQEQGTYLGPPHASLNRQFEIDRVV